MLLVARIRLTSAFLGELKPDRGGVRRFRKELDNIFVHTTKWQETFGHAARQLQINIDPKAITPPRFIIPASIHLFRRTWSQVNVELFESFRKGTILTIDFMIRDDVKRAPTKEEFGAILALTGTHFGLSQFGNGFGFGRFIVLDVSEIAFRNGQLEHAAPPVQEGTTNAGHTSQASGPGAG